MAQLLRGKTRKIILCLFDMCTFAGISALYFLMSRALEKPVFSGRNYILNCLILIVCMMIFRLAMRVYRNVWRYTDTKAYFKMVLADFFGMAVACGISYLLSDVLKVDFIRIWFFVDVAALFCLTSLMARFTYRLLYKHFNAVDAEKESRINVAIVGAGQIGATLVAELLSNQKSVYKPIFFIDKDPMKIGGRISGLPVYPADLTIFAKLKESSIQEVFVAITNLDAENAEHIYEFYSKADCKIKIYDTPVRAVGKENTSAHRTIRQFSIEDLLFRDPLKINDEKTVSYYTGKTVLVTGGGGSIGSELCRQIAKCHPKQLVIFDIYENNAYEIQQELIRNYGENLNLAVEIGSVRDRKRLDCIFKTYLPDVVFHAAAHKHVPLMEFSPTEVIKNNILGTYNTADMAEKYNAQKFILISTDKAVNPTNIMGASKRMCEMVIQCRGDSKTNFAAVRFGNVLGSNGSVIPLFKKQIASGGPVTITDKRIIRYFMTIPEASQLVMQAGAMAKKGELFVLDMGKPVSIYSLAVNMIRLSGFEPDVDIKIEEIGLRPGEKLYEELLMQNEDLDKTDNDLIFVEKDKPFTREEINERIARLKDALDESEEENDKSKIKKILQKIIDTYHDPDEVNKKADDSKEMKDAKKGKKKKDEKESDKEESEKNSEEKTSDKKKKDKKEDADTASESSDKSDK